MARTKSVDAAAKRLIEAFEAAIDEASDRTAEAIRAEIPAYSRVKDPALFDDVRQHTAANLHTMARSLRENRAVTEEELLFVRGPTTRRARVGLPLGDYLRAFRIGNRVAWDTLVRGVEDDDARAAALGLAAPVLEYINIVSTQVAEVYVEVERLLLAEGERLRRDVLDDLLAGRRPPPGAREEALRAAALASGGTHVVIAAGPQADPEDEHLLRAAATALGRVGARTSAPLSVLRGSEIVAILPLARGRAGALGDALRRARSTFAAQGLALTIGASTIVEGFDRLPAAYLEASDARGRAGAGDGVVCLCELSAFDYLALIGDETARRLLSPEVARFVAEDLADGGALMATLVAYADTGLNAKAAADRLYLHVNTAHYRLRRIGERTGRDVRSVSDVVELLLALRLLSGRDN